MLEGHDKAPESYAVLQYLWMVILATFGGFVSYLKRVNDGVKFNWATLTVELITAAFVGITTSYLCQAVGLSHMLTIALVSISGHFSKRSLNLFAKMFDKTLGGSGD